MTLTSLGSWPVRSGMALLGSMVLLTGCQGAQSSSEFAPLPSAQSPEGPSLSAGVDVFCARLKKVVTDNESVPPVIQCNLDKDSKTGQVGIVVAFDDPVSHLVENGIDVTYETAFAPMTAIAQAYFPVASLFDEVNLVLVFFKDECGNVWEVKPNTLLRMGAGEIDLTEGMNEVEIFGTPNCP